MIKNFFKKEIIGTIVNEIPPGEMNLFCEVGDINQDGLLDIVGKPLHGPEMWNVHVWFNERKL